MIIAILPNTGEVILDAIPDAMRSEPRWVLWRYEDQGGPKLDKVPRQPNGRKALVNTPSTWRPLAEVLAVYATGRYSGIGFMLGDGWAGIDLDDCFDADGVLSEFAEGIVAQAGSYVERSPSGLGLHILVRGDMPAGKRDMIDGNKVEVYGKGHYLTFTGDRLEESPATVEDAQPLLDTLVGQLGGRSSARRDVEPWWPDTAPVADLAPWRRRVETLPEAVQGSFGGVDTFHAACEIRRWSLNRDDSWDLMLHYNRERCSPPWDEVEERGPNSLARNFNRACAAVCGDLTTPEEDFAPACDGSEEGFPDPLVGAEGDLAVLPPAPSPAAPPPATASFPRTDLGNAERIACRYGDELRYVGAWNRWLVWDGARWRTDETGGAMQRVKLTVRSIYTEAADTSDPDTRTALAKHAAASESRSRLEAALVLARSEKPIPATPESFDADSYALNCLNGTIDLRTGELRPHDPGDLLTKTTGVEVADLVDGPPTLWLRFLDKVFGGDAELVAFVQRLFGYALIGLQAEHVFPILWGGGANGKSVFIGTLQHCFGEYATVAAPRLFTVKRHESHPTELADLHGRRLVVLNETQSGDRLDEGLVKSITGGDRIRARRMREDFWEFDPSHTACMVTNHKPTVQGCDEGIWRRLLLVPFDVTIPPGERDTRLAEKLRRETPAILRWLVDGCLAWQRDGLNPPERVQAATRAYRAEADPVAKWFVECCDIAPGECCSAKALAGSYEEWARHRGETPRTAAELGAWLVASGKKKGRRSTGVVYEGVQLTL